MPSLTDNRQERKNNERYPAIPPPFAVIRVGDGRLAGLGEAGDGLAEAGDLESEIALRQFAECAGAVAEQAVGEFRAAGLGRTQR